MKLEERIALAVEGVAIADGGSTRCARLKFLYDSLQAIKATPGCPHWLRFCIRQVHGGITKLKEKWGC